MAFRPESVRPDFTRLKSQLAQMNREDNALYQTIKGLIQAASQDQGITVTQIEEIFAEIEQSNTFIIEIIEGDLGGYPNELGYAKL